MFTGLVSCAGFYLRDIPSLQCQFARPWGGVPVLEMGTLELRVLPPAELMGQRHQDHFCVIAELVFF